VQSRRQKENVLITKKRKYNETRKRAISQALNAQIKINHRMPWIGSNIAQASAM